jgi:replication factor A1
LKIKEAKNARKGINIEALVISIESPRNVNLKDGGVGQVAAAVIDDGSDTIPLTLWNEDIKKVKVGSRLVINNGYTTEFKGKVQLNIGKYGKLEVKA